MEEIIEKDEIKNFWIVYLMPFAENERKEELVKKYQENCIKKRIFGMGWNGNSEDFSKKYKNKILTDEIVNEYERDYNSVNIKKGKISYKSLKNFSLIKENDIVIMRLKNAHYYIGMVDNNGTRYCDGKDILNDDNGNNEYAINKKNNMARLSWYCSVKEWYEFSEYELPQDIVGRFSQKMHSTIERIGTGENIINNTNARIKHCLYNLYKQKYLESLHKDFEFPKIELSLETFTEALNYKDLEDLVYLYILEQEKEHNYILLPSECKVTKMKYEFDLIEKKSKDNDKSKIITCQVKNHAIVDYSKYVEDAQKKIYHKIYLFSGINIYGEDKINENEAYIRIKDESLENVIKIINRKKLYNFLINNDFLWSRKNLKKFYKIKD